MENLENQNLIPETDSTPDLQPEMSPADASQTESVSAPTDFAPLDAEAEPIQEEAQPAEDAAFVESPQPPKYEWDCGMPFPPPKKEKIRTARSGKHVWKRIIACVAMVALVVTGCLITGTVLNSYWMGENYKLQQQISALTGKLDRLQVQNQNNSSVSGGNTNPNVGISGALTPAQVYSQNVAAVVTISSPSATGSGFILTENGYIITNYHVIENAIKVEVTLSNGDSYAAKIIGFDAAHDVAVLKIEDSGLPHVILGSSNDLTVGDQITVIGNPLGELSYTQTVGYISGKDRGISTDNVMINMLQTDASINSGNSGGPMFNMRGEVVGIITAKYSGTSSSGASIEGVGFAIPIDDVLKKIQDLIEFGYITGPYLGVSVRDMDTSVSQAFGLPMGAYVVSVETGNCAYAAGVREKDIIIGLGEHEIESLNDLTSALQEFKAGDSTTIKVWRSGVVHEFNITLDEKPH